MKILFISAADKDFDGRTRALTDILKKFADVIEITGTKKEDHKEHEHFRISLQNGYYTFIKKSIIAGKTVKNVDCIFVDNRKATIPALKLYKILHPKKMYYDARELYLKNEVKGITSKIGCLFEEKMIAKADFVICANYERKKIMEKKFTHKNDILVFENFRKLLYTKDGVKEIVEKKYGNIFEKGYTHIISTAGCEIERGADKLVKAVSNLSYPNQLFLVGCKNNNETEQIKDFVKKNNMENVYFIPRLNQDELKYFISKCDIGVAMYHKKNSNNLYCSSGKVYEYIYEGLPVAVTDNPPLQHLVETYPVGCANADIKIALEKVFSNYTELLNGVNDFRNEKIVEKKQEEFTELLKHNMIGGE